MCAEALLLPRQKVSFFLRVYGAIIRFFRWLPRTFTHKHSLVITHRYKEEATWDHRIVSLLFLLAAAVVSVFQVVDEWVGFRISFAGESPTQVDVGFAAIETPRPRFQVGENEGRDYHAKDR